MKGHLSRRKLREHLFKLVYLYAFNVEEDMQEQVKLYLDGIHDLDDEDRAYLETTYPDIAGHIPEIDELLTRTAKGWKTNRFASCDLALLRLAVYEMRYTDHVPEGVAINEAVELAKLYGGDESPSFINGILGEISRQNS